MRDTVVKKRDRGKEGGKKRGNVGGGGDLISTSQEKIHRDLKERSRVRKSNRVSAWLD